MTAALSARALEKRYGSTTALGGVDLAVYLIDQRIEFGVVPERIVLWTTGAIPCIEIIRGVEQGRHDGADRQ